jgi:predicted transcriptional regulator
MSLENLVTILSGPPVKGDDQAANEPATSDVANLLFNLASPVRLQQLEILRARRVRMTQLAKMTNATIQETSRHLARMRESKIIDKDSDGVYGLTSFGSIILCMVPALRVLALHRNFLLAHDLTLLPPEFVGRVGALARAEFDGKAGLVQRRYERMISEAMDHLWIMGDSITVSGERIGELLPSRDVCLRILFPAQGLATPLSPREELENIKKAFQGEIEVRSAERTEAGLVLNEESARFIAPDLSGRLDYNVAFGGADPAFHCWCRDLFVYYWNRSKRVAYVNPTKK